MSRTNDAFPKKMCLLLISWRRNTRLSSR